MQTKISLQSPRVCNIAGHLHVTRVCGPFKHDAHGADLQLRLSSLHSGRNCLQRLNVSMPQVLARTSKAGTGGFVAGRSFGSFGIRNRLRLLVFRIMFSQVHNY